MNRRKFLLAASSVTTVGIAGCMGNTIEEYPEGLSEEGVENVEALFGSDSPYLNSDSVQLNITTEREQSTTETTIQVDAEEENSFVRTEDMTTGQDSQETQRTVLRYHTGQLRYERVESSSSEQVRYRRSQNQFDKTVEFYANFLSDLLTDVEFSGSEITEEGLIQYESEDIGSENNLSPETDAIEDVNMVVRFREDGRPESITANITTVQQQQPTQQSSSESETSESSTQEIVQEVSFSNYNSVDVPEPDWLEEADQQVEERRANQPSGNITFSESTNGEVTVTVESLENTDSVDIVVDGSISDRDVSEGETVTYDSPGSIQVIDQTESGRLVRIDTYSSG